MVYLKFREKIGKALPNNFACILVPLYLYTVIDQDWYNNRETPNWILGSENV